MKRRGPHSILIETSSAAQAKSITQCPNLAGADLVVRPLGKLRPRVIVYGVPRALSEAEVLAALKGQNFPNITEECFREGIKLVFKTGPRDRDTVNWVLEVSPKMRDLFKAQGRLYVQWNSCRVDDHLTITRCYKCQALGHVAKMCKASQVVCGHCSRPGHEWACCPNGASAPVCAGCSGMGRPSDHLINGIKCAMYQRALGQKAAMIDYGECA